MDQFFYKSWYSKGVENVAHLVKDSTTLISYHEFEERFAIKTNFVAFQGLILALKSLKKLNRGCLLSRFVNCLLSLFPLSFD